MRDEDKHRGPEYVPAGPVRLRTGFIREPSLLDLVKRIERLESPMVERSEPGPINLDALLRRVSLLESQVASLQMDAPRGIPKP